MEFPENSKYLKLCGNAWMPDSSLTEDIKVNNYNEDFWNALDELVNTSEIVIDRPKGSAHPRFPDFIYRVDYGYLRNTSSMDGAGIDVWVGSGQKTVDAIMCIIEDGSISNA